MSSVPVDNWWSTIEVQCVSMDFSYEDYVDLHKKSNCPGAILCSAAYKLVEKTFMTQFSYDMAEIQDELRD